MKDGTRSGLWQNFAYAIQQLEPSIVIAENVRGIRSARTAESERVLVDGPRGGRKVGHTRRALGRVLWDLAYLGFDAAWGSYLAADVGACHRRQRVFIVAWQPTSVGMLYTAASKLPGITTFVGDRIPDSDLLPTPPVNDMGASKTLEWWDEWAPRQKSSEGKPAPHGRSLSIEVRRSLDRYDKAIRRWESVHGDAPEEPTVVSGTTGHTHVSPEFLEWMMGFPRGWASGGGLGLSRNVQTALYGNAVVPQQAEMAISDISSAVLAGRW